MSYDVAIIGAGMAGASVAASLDPRLTVALIEAEPAPGYHATGRSAAFWDECYGGPGVLPLTQASGPFLASPPVDWNQASFLSPRGALYIGTTESSRDFAEFSESFRKSGVQLEARSAAQLARDVPGMFPAWELGLFAPDCSDIDVARLHQAFLARARQHGTHLALRSAVTSVQQVRHGWRVETTGGRFEAKTLVNAAGAWADDIALMAGVPPLGLAAMRRTMVQVRFDVPVPATLPLVIDMSGQFYFKSTPTGAVWLSPQDETPTLPCDAAPDEMDVAIALERLSSVVDWQIVRVEHSWAGLRTFSPDRLPVYGYAESAPGFFWCVGQGGFGIQTAPAAAELCAALIEHRAQTAMLSAIKPELYAPQRFAKRSI